MKKTMWMLAALAAIAAHAADDEPVGVTSGDYTLDLRPMPRLVTAGVAEDITYKASASVTCDNISLVHDAAEAGDYMWTPEFEEGEFKIWTFMHFVGNTWETATFCTPYRGVMTEGGETVGAEAGEEVQITAPEYPGYAFKEWETDDVTLADVTANPAVFTMPDRNVTLTPVYTWAPEIALSASKGADGTVAITARVAAYPAPSRVEGETSGTMRFEFERETGDKIACVTWATEPESWVVTEAEGGTVAGVWNLVADLGEDVELTEAARVYAVVSAGENPVFDNTVTPSYPWTEDAEKNAMKSGGKGVANVNSSYQMTLTGPGDLEFEWMVSSESVNYDYLECLVDGVRYNRIGGTSMTSFTTQSVYLRNKAAGEKTVITWNYHKDGSVNSGSDCGWVKNIRWDGKVDLAMASCALTAVGSPFRNEEADPDVPPEGAVSQFDVTVVYDGFGHTLDVGGVARLMADYAKDGAGMSYYGNAQSCALLLWTK